MATVTAVDFLKFVNASPSPFHATAECERRLLDAGFTRLSERELWDPKPGGLYFITRNQSAVCAFAVGGKYVPGNGFTIAAAHTDSPCLRVKPVSTLKKAAFLSVGVETYGGGLWYTWLDRDLGLAGRAIVAKADGGFDSRLVRLDGPILRVPSLAIHLDREVNTAGLKLNAESHLAPVLATAVKDLLLAPLPAAAAAGAGGVAPSSAAGTAAAVAEPASAGALSRHHASLVRALAEELHVAPEAVHDFELSLYDAQPAAIGGLHKEFIFSARCVQPCLPGLSRVCFTSCLVDALPLVPVPAWPYARTRALSPYRLDNLMMTYTTLVGLIRSVGASAATATLDGAAAVPAASASSSFAAVPLAEDPNVRVMAAFDHEEVGSSSVPGAGSTLLEDVIRRLCPEPRLQPVALRRSVLVSADMAHAQHPNHAALHEENHRPAMHGGIVIKCNANQRYATTAVTGFLFRRLAEEARVPVQFFVNRQDMGCGSTIGPIVATRLGVRTVDVGVPQLSMHSAREMCGTDDAQHAADFFAHFYGRFPALDASIEHAD